MNIRKIIIKIGTIISIYVVFYTFIHQFNAPKGYEFYWLVPLTYLLLFHLTNMKLAIYKYVGISIMNLIFFVRYIILPFFSTYTGLYFHTRTGIGKSESNLIAILLIIYEMICIFIVFHFVIRRLNKEKNIHKLTNNKNLFVYIFVILVGVFSYIAIPGIKERLNFIIAYEIDYKNLNTISYIAFLLTINTTVVLFLLLVSIKYKNITNRKFGNSLLIILISLINISIFWGTNRLTVLAQGIITIIILKETKLLSNKLTNLMGVVIIFIILSLSSLRWFGEGELDNFYDDSGDYLSINQQSDYLQTYFGGTDLISTAITVKSKIQFDNRIETFFNEILSNVVFVRQLFPLSNNSSMAHFNSYFGRYTKTGIILPTLGQGYMYFGFLGAPLLSILFSLILYRGELALIRSNNIGERYALYLLVVWLAFFPMQNLNIVTAAITFKFLPLYLIVITNKKINFKPK